MGYVVVERGVEGDGSPAGEANGIRCDLPEVYPSKLALGRGHDGGSAPLEKVCINRPGWFEALPYSPQPL